MKLKELIAETMKNKLPVREKRKFITTGSFFTVRLVSGIDAIIVQTVGYGRYFLNSSMGKVSKYRQYMNRPVKVMVSTTGHFRALGSMGQMETASVRVLATKVRPSVTPPGQIHINHNNPNMISTSLGRPTQF
jgi:hypothetical protein